jgi:predicted CoA-binding protein
MRGVVMNEPDTIRDILKLKTIAVVGLSPKPERPSHRVAAYMQSQGYRIIPVNPGQKEILGEKCYSSLKEIPDAVDVVDVFRSPEHVPPFVDEAIDIKAKALWLQDGVVNEKAATKAEEAGLLVVMDDCILRQHQAQNDPNYAPHCEI